MIKISGIFRSLVIICLVGLITVSTTRAVWSDSGDTAIFFFVGPHDAYRKFGN